MPTPIILSSTYELREEIGSGGGGVIYKAWHVRLKKDVVLKKLRRGSAASLQTQRAEADILKTLRHSYLPQLYDFLIEGEDVYTVIDFIPGQSLDKLLKDGKHFPQQQVIKWAGQLLEALCYLHSQKPPILHSDIKPANIMLTPNGDICLIDFNISLILGDSGAVMVGRSHGYASPEQYGEAATSVDNDATELDDSGDNSVTMLMYTEETELDHTEALIQNSAPDDNHTAHLLSAARGGSSQRGSRTSSVKTTLDVRSDIYNLGATLYHLLTGEKPAIATGKVKPLGAYQYHFSEGVTYIIEKAMSKNPAERFQTSAEMLRAVRNIHKLDRRWKMQTLKKHMAAIVLSGLFAASGILAFLGWQRMGLEKIERYDSAVYEMESAADPVRAEQLFAYATELFPERLDAYHAKALIVFRAGLYQECQTFIKTSLILLHPSADNPSEMARMGDIYYIMAGCYFEREEYPNAAVYYKEAVNYNQSNAEYYRDYAIALARSGDIPTAESLLVTAESMGLGGDSLDLLRGEIAYAKGQYQEAVEHFRGTIQATRDDYILYRAYRVSADAYKRQNDYESEIALLTEAKGILPPERVNELTERLADAYVRGAQSGENSGDYYQKAAESFEELLDRGYSTFLIKQNLVIVYQQTGDLTAAEQILLELAAEYPEDYRVPMRLAYLYADMQSQLANEQRDYTQVAECYDNAQVLYEEQTRNGFSDPEMLMLADVLDQLAAGGWLARYEGDL